MIQIVFLDIDGTILSHKTNSVPITTIYAIKFLREKGIKVFVCTGRNKCEYKQMSQLKEIAFDGFIFMGGALSIYNNKVISEYPIARNDLTTIAHFLKENPISMTVVEKEEQYMNFYDEYTLRALKDIHTPVPPIKELKDLLEKQTIYQITAFPHSSFFQDLCSKLKEVYVTSWNPYGYDLVSKKSGKGNAIKDVCKYLSIPLENALAIGDGDNDIDMLQTVGISVAMGNGVEKVKTISNYVTEDVDNDGLYLALRHYNLL